MRYRYQKPNQTNWKIKLSGVEHGFKKIAKKQYYGMCKCTNAMASYWLINISSVV